MDFMKDPETANSYRKHKLKVKKWEKDFKKKFGRIPSKYDIKEAATDVRYSYKRYFDLKTSALEESLSQVDDDLDVSNFDSFGSMDGFDSFSGSQDLCDDYSPNGMTLPTVEGLQKLLEGAPKSKSFDKVTVEQQSDSLRKNLVDANLCESSSSVWGQHLSKNKQEESVDNSKLNDLNTTLSQRLHSKTTFPKMPRKSLKKSTSSAETNSSNTSNVKNVSQKEISQKLDTDLDKINIITYSDSTSYSLNVFNSSQNNHINLFKVDEGWLKRCQNKSKADENKDSKGHKTLNDIQFENTELKDSLNKNEKYVLSSNLKQVTSFGLSNVNVTPMANDVTEAHFSDYVENSESEDESMSKVLKSKIRPVLKKRKLENRNEKVSPISSENIIKNAENKYNPSNKVKSKLKTKKLKQNGKNSSRSKNFRIAIPDTVTKELDFEDYYPDVNSESRSVPRYQLQPSILKDKNLIDGLASVVEFPVALKKSKKTVTKALTPEERMQLKIDSGTLNENFVSINIEKKVYVRGKKNISYSTFKKQQWKKKKAALGGADFPTAGVPTCFKCGESGHMSRYCTAHKGQNLLPLEAVRDFGALPTLEEAKISNSDETQPKEHAIPESFLKLLNEPTTLTNLQKKRDTKIMPVLDGQMTDSLGEVQAALKEFGHSEFRPGQEKAIMRILSGQSTLVTLSTGSGKSLCYQLPAYLYAKRQNCITIVISPLVSLMEDQVLNMPSFLRAGCLHTNQSPTQRSKIMELIKDGMLDILLISPEAVVSSDRGSGFGGLLRQLPPIAFACIDEVHCVSQWSHNFRPTYLMICRVLKEKLKVTCILGLSATATKITMKAVIDHIGISDGLDGVITNLPLPNNLILSVSRDNDKDRALLSLLTSDKFMEYKSIIVYCIRRDICEQVAAKIRATIQHPNENETTQTNIKKRKKVSFLMAAAYHAGMSSAQRRRVQENFMNGNLRIVVATVAFGMGIDKSNVRGVIHYNMPSTFESYVQEVGRAGRDGLPAHCHVFISTDNCDKNELLRHIYANSIERHAIRKLLQRVFVPCQCKITSNENVREIDKENCEGINKNTEKNTKRCEGHEVAIPIDDCVAELDIPSENIMTLLCYLELHPKKFVQVLNNAYVICKVMSYNGPQYLQKLAHSCPPLAMGLAFVRKQGGDVNKESTIEFNVIEVAAAIGWDSGMAKYHLKNLEWENINGLPKKAPIRIEFNTLGFRLKAPGDLTSSELDGALDILHARVQSQEHNMVYQLEEISKTLFEASHEKIINLYLEHDNNNLKEKSEKLKETIREYFNREVPKENVELEERCVNEGRAISDIRGLISAYRDCIFTGRAIARILQGVSSPNFPALVWGRCPFWRTHLHEDFNKIAKLATQQIIQMK